MRAARADDAAARDDQRQRVRQLALQPTQHQALTRSGDIQRTSNSTIAMHRRGYGEPEKGMRS
jgi:hypothetical protein